MKFGKVNVSKKLAREFFKMTNSNPEDLIFWLKRYIKRRHPCLIERYHKQYIIYGASWTFSSTEDFVFLPIDVDALHKYLKTKENLNQFIKFLKTIEVKK